MDNTGYKILQNQNKANNIDKLLAQRTLYSIGKGYQGLLLFITIPIPIFISFLINFYPKIDDKNLIFVFLTIILIVLEKVFETIINRNKKIAASIQEKFDLDVLNIKENETLNLAYIDLDIIREFSKKARKDNQKVQKVTNWYSDKIVSLATNVSILFCQRMNICYDFSIRRKYNIYLGGLSLFTFIILLFISLYMGITLKSFILQVLLPCLPIFNYSYKEINANIESIDNLQKLKEIIEHELSISNNSSVINEHKLRNIQDRIFNNRILSPLIPDFIYKLFWSKLEDQMNYSVENKINELN
ncbi:S-4TM family putative pore-forming effector [Chryseobacterium sp. ERMR1:04]|uniref:S-4TM family putative pore-forming effector n=1 Tax=Chryseobacterium sp. ERMR1:04 TaxID=1705393 RepID=UPI0006C8B75A|nr:S-4TM family putative pore-forming effector [Chryseobacterium sp. ERMR1:04]KPH14058.1 hypothetical protein AMQ68_00585 [Chryseobacterium sp. ERMR1:04]